MPPKKSLTSQQAKQLLATLKSRFEKNPHRHKGLKWLEVEARLGSAPEKLWTLAEMERTGGEPDVVAIDKSTTEFIFYDCAAESPKGRRSFCYDRSAWQSRKEAKPKNNAIDAAAAMGADILTEDEYRALQQFESPRHKNLIVDHHPHTHPRTRRRSLLRSPLRHRLHLSQRRRVLLRRPRLPLLPKSVATGLPRHSVSMPWPVPALVAPASCRRF